MKTYTVVALDLEGTLISNAMSQFPRQGLFRFLELCGLHIPNVVLYTAVREPLALKIVKQLADEKLVPEWFGRIDYIQWSGTYKDLSLIPGHLAEQALLVDDNQDYIDPTQHVQWIPIQDFAHPYEDDHELQRVWTILQERLSLSIPW